MPKHKTLSINNLLISPKINSVGTLTQFTDWAIFYSASIFFLRFVKYLKKIRIIVSLIKRIRLQSDQFAHPNTFSIIACIIFVLHHLYNF